MLINQGHDDPQIRRQFGSDSARLVYGRYPENGKLLHISKASHGLGCGLICLHCKAALVANLKDDLKAAHFAHHGNRPHLVRSRYSISVALEAHRLRLMRATGARNGAELSAWFVASR